MIRTFPTLTQLQFCAKACLPKSINGAFCIAVSASLNRKWLMLASVAGMEGMMGDTGVRFGVG